MKSGKRFILSAIRFWRDDRAVHHLLRTALAIVGCLFCHSLFGVSKTLTFSDCEYAETPLPPDYASDKVFSLTWGTQRMTSSLIMSTGALPFSDHSPDPLNRLIIAQGTTVIEFNPTVRLIRMFVRDNEPDFVQFSASGLTVVGELEGSLVFTRTVDFVPAIHSGVWMEVAGEGAIDTLRVIGPDDLTKSYLMDDVEFEIYSETQVIALAGYNQEVMEGSVVGLDGTESLNAESLSWVQVLNGNEPEVQLSPAGNGVVTFVAPHVQTAAVLTFELTASGPLGADTDRVEITVHISTAPTIAPHGLTVLPTEIGAAAELGSVVEWTPHPDASHYVVYRAEGDPQNAYVKVAPSISLTSYRDDWLEEGSIYFYTVAAANEFGVGPPSEAVGFVARRNLALDADATPIARIMNPTGTGLRDIQAIRNGLTTESYDSYHGWVKATEDWYAYLYQQPRYFDAVIYYEGQNFHEGGWWTSLSVQYTQDGANWKDVNSLSISPPYNFEDRRRGRLPYTRFYLTFERCRGIGIRLYGQPGGMADFTSVAELEVYGDQAPDTVIANAGPDLREEEGTPITLHGDNSHNVEEFLWQQVELDDEPQVALSGADTANPTFTVEDVPGNTLFCFRLTVTGLHGPKSDEVIVTVVNREPPPPTTGLSATGGDRNILLSWQTNNDATAYRVFRSASPAGGATLLATGTTATSYLDNDPDLEPYHTYYYHVVAVNDYGEGAASNVASGVPIENLAMYPDALPIARVTHPTGSGEKDLEVIRNGILDENAYDSYDGPNPAEDDWYGYLWDDPIYPDRIVYTMGRNFLDGGWWSSLTVQYTTDRESWLTAPNVTLSPAYNFEDDPAPEDGPPRADYSQYTLTFDRVRAVGVRIYGKPGGLVDFTSIVELEVYGLDAPVVCERDILPLFYVPGENAEINLHIETHEFPPPDSLTVTEKVPEGAVVVQSGGGSTSVPGEITWHFGPGQVREMNLAYTIGVKPGVSQKLSFEGFLSYAAVSDQRIRGEDVLYAKPLPPANLRLEMGLVGHLRWSPVLAEGTAGYRVYRSVNGQGYEDVSGLITDAFFDDPYVEGGMSYLYKVTVQNVAGAESSLAESEQAGPASVVMTRREFEDYDHHEPGGPVNIRTLGGGGRFVAGLTEGDRWNFNFNLAEEGYVKIADLRAASVEEATYEFLWDDSPVGNFSFNTRGESNWWTHQMDIPAFSSPSGNHTLTIVVSGSSSNADFFGVGFGWPPPAREPIFAENFDRYFTTEDVENLGGWSVIGNVNHSHGSWELWNTAGPPLAQEEPGPAFPGFSSGYMVSNGELADNVELDERLVSPEIDCSRYICVAVQFVSAINIYDKDGDLQTTDFDISLYDETSQSWSDWVNLFTRDRNGGDDFSAIPKWFDVSSLADGKNVKFRWRFYNTRNDYWWAVDEIRVSGEKRRPRITGAVLSPDSGVTLSWEHFGQGLYTVECSDKLVGGEWQPVPGTQWPTTQTTWHGDETSAARARFYRVSSQ